MRVILIVSKDYLPIVNQMIDQRNVKIVAIVTDDRTVAVNHGYPHSFVFGFWQLKTVLERFDPDYVLFLAPFRLVIDPLTRQMREMKFPLNRICDLSAYPVADSLQLEINLRKIQEKQYRIFATGISYSRTGIDQESFELPLLSFAFSSQDLYYDFKIAERILENLAPPPRKNSEGLSYALIGLAPYSLHYDLSQCTREAYFIARYFLSLEDLHNYWIDYETVASFIRPEFLNHLRENAKTMKFEHQLTRETMNLHTALEASNEIATWNRKSYPATVTENKQILEKYLQLLETHEIFPIIFLPPMMQEYQEEFCPEKIDELFSFLYDLMKSHRFALVNGWKMPGFVDHDFRDINHMNINGARKFSAKINELIVSLERKK